MSQGAAPPVYLFGPFCFDAARGALLRDGAPLRVGTRALAILAALLERPGELLTKRELMALAWPGQVVAEGNIKVNIAALRQALGDSGPAYRYLISVSGRGYRFAAPVSRRSAAPQARFGQPPAPPARAFGREETLAALWRQLTQRRCVTIAGPGGIGKTTVALALAASAARQHALDTCFVDLAPLPDPCFMAGALATALGLGVASHDVVPALLATLRERRLLLVLDSCEHVLDTAAELVERILAAAPGVLLLSTSREPLRTAGESVHRLAPLGCPPVGARLDARQALRYPAIALFAERAGESLQGYRLVDADVPAVSDICRRLDGIALAIELAATRIDAFGARELALRLDDRFRLLRRGRRGAQARHRTLAAALDWSYGWLPPREQAILRAASVFAGGFTLDSAAALCSGSETEAPAIVDAVTDLVAKSLLVLDHGAVNGQYRLLDTTRAYAQEKLEECGETAVIRRRHALLQRAILERAAREWEARPSTDWLLDYGRCIDDLRLALAWAASGDGDAAIAIALTVAALPLWMHLSLLDECRRAIEAALAMGEGARSPAPRERMKLHAGRAAASLYADGPLAETAAAWACALDLAEQLDDGEYRLRALWGLAVHRTYAGEHRAALAPPSRWPSAFARWPANVPTARPMSAPAAWWPPPCITWATSAARAVCSRPCWGATWRRYSARTWPASSWSSVPPPLARSPMCSGSRACPRRRWATRKPRWRARAPAATRCRCSMRWCTRPVRSACISATPSRPGACWTNCRRN